MTKAILEVDNLQVVYPTPRGEVYALRGISLSVEAGQIYGIVGESGCGKSTIGRAIIGLVPPPGKVTNGRVLYHGEDLIKKDEKELRSLRGRRISMVFQDPAAALNPLFTIGQQLMAIMNRHRIPSREQRAMELLEDLGLPNPQDILSSYSHQLSGGQQQRAMIAMALCTEPDLMIADEPTSCLDVTIQSQILDLLVKLREERGVTILLITHDLGVVAETCDQVAVFYLGSIVEEGTCRDIFRNPRHPYTRGLLAALPNPQSWGTPLKVIPGSIPTNLQPTPGCAFASRCDQATQVCHEVNPPFIGFGGTHRVSCHRYAKLTTTQGVTP